MTRRGGGREYERSARVGQLMREILASELDSIDDERVFAIALTGVDVDNELEKAVVHFDADDAADALDALEEHTGRLRRAVSVQARLRKTPRLEFRLDEAVGGGGRIEDILAQPRDTSRDPRRRLMARRRPAKVHGFLVVDKPAGITKP